jgi:tryptophan 6-halogenase
MAKTKAPLNRIDRVTIVGGGTAGWLSAAMLGTFLNERHDGPPIEITLIESPRVPTIGVGEATVPGMRALLQRIGLDEGEFLRRCNASFKYAVRFSDWNLDASGKGIDFYHPFDAPENIRGKNPTLHYHRYGPRKGPGGLIDAVLPNAAMINGQFAPRMIGGNDFEGVISYSYHLDAGLFANYVKEVTLARGINHIVDDVVDVNLDERGYVSELILEEGGSHPVEMVVDCTGFRGLIIGDALKEPFHPWNRQLLCDRALAVQLPHVDPKNLEPCTTSTALGAGWVWNLPLYNRVGTGYVFSSAFRTDEEARDEFVAHLEGKGFKVDEEPRAIQMHVGRRERTWVKNCVSIGLAGGFVEPLEATAIHTISATLRLFAANFPDRSISQPLADRFNRSVGELYDNIVDFIVMHYLTSNREEPFWLAARNEIDVPESLQENMALWQHILPSDADISGVNLFGPPSFLSVLYAKGRFDDVTFPLEGSIDKTDWQEYVERMKKLKANYAQHLPRHYDFLTDLRNQAARKLLGVA